MGMFRVALSSDFLKADGTPAFPMFDLTPLDEDPRVEWGYVPVTEGRIAAEDMVGYDAVILLTAKFDRNSFPGDGRLSIIARFGVGYDTVDVDACNDNDVALVIAPSGVRRPVAVSILTFLLTLSTKMMAKDRLTRQGPDGWAQVSDHMGVGLVGRTFGAIGMGNIGAEAFRLAKPLDMRFIAHDSFVAPELAKSLGVELVSLEEVFKESDFLSVSCPLNEETRGLVNAERLASMKPTAYLINTARGPIVDQTALTKALQDGVIAGAALDVFEIEPSSADDPLFALDNVITTPHSLCFTDQCFAELGATDLRAVLAVLNGEVPEAIVNGGIVESEGWRGKLERERLWLIF